MFGISGTLPGETEDPFNLVYSFEISEDGKFINPDVTELSSDAFSRDPAYLDYPKDEIALPEQPPERLSPFLRKKLAGLPVGERLIEPLIISFEDEVKIPRFAETVADEAVDSSANQRVIARNGELIRQIEAEREPTYRRINQRLEALGGKVVETFWLTSGVIAEMPLSAVSALLTFQDVVYVSSANETSPPPADVSDARARINSDWYFNQGLNGGMIALIDTGVRESHVLISEGSYSRIRDQYNCLSGSCQRETTATDQCNHGTSSAAILSGDNSKGNSFRGVTGIGIDSFVMYNGCNGSLAAAIAAFDKAMELGHKVIVAEMQVDLGFNSELSRRADQAFDSGAMIIAANGNYGSEGAGSVRAPANAHKAFGVGAYLLPSSQYSGQSLGPTSDGRIKPDIQAPTSTQTADASSNTATRTYCCTSGATPYAAGAAALVRNYFRANYGITDPGMSYAYLISSGDDPYQFGNTRGAGRFRLHATTTFNNLVKVSISHGQTINIPVTLNSVDDFAYLKASLWWPESANQAHNDIDLFLIDPGGTVRGTSASIPSIFEFTQVNNPVSGTWTLRVSGKDVNTGSQTVYVSRGAKRQ